MVIQVKSKDNQGLKDQREGEEDPHDEAEVILEGDIWEERRPLNVRNLKETQRRGGHQVVAKNAPAKKKAEVITTKGITRRRS